MKNSSGTSSTQNRYPLEILEFGQIRDYILTLLLSDSGRELFMAAEPFRDRQLLKEKLERIAEMRSLIDFDEALPLQSFSDVRISLKKAEVEGAFIQAAELLEIHHVLTMSRQIAEYFSNRAEKYPLIRQVVRSLEVLQDLEQEIQRVISPHGDVKDTASPELRNLRRSIQAKESRIRQRLNTILKTMVKQGYAQEDQLTFRDGRLLIPMKDGQSGHLKGVIVDQSSSGSTLFIEPLEILETNNEIRRLRMQETRELERILKALTAQVRIHCQSIANDFNCLTHLDVLSGLARYANEIHGCAAEISEHHLCFKEAKHPLLLMTHAAQDVVPLSLEIGESSKTLVITGPNAGGKTVALKTVGLLAVMHAYGYHVPAQPGTQIPLFSQVFADIGDQQSIEQDLSTFSSHVQYLADIHQKADKNTLVLMDEIGSATDPAEGSALAMTLLRRLTQRSCLTIATTHMGALKVFAHEEPGIENGSMIFDQKSLQPTYRFQMGVPGSSYAFEIARRYGIPDEFIRESQALLGEDRGKLDQLILTLEKEHSRTHALLEAAEQKDSRLSGLIMLYQDRIDRIKKEADTEKQKIVAEAEQMLSDANATVERLVKEIRETGAGRETIRKAKKEIRSSRKRAGAMAKKKEAPSYIARQGDWVLWEGHSGRGEVVSDPDRDKRVLVQWGDIRLKIPVSALKQTQPPEQKRTSGVTSIESFRTVRDQIDLRGMTVEEAIESVEQYLGDAHSTGYGSVRIIHGKGTGTLRREIGAYLKRHRLVKSQRPGNWNEGDLGVTVVELK